jgi:hypothetical protein
MTRINSAIPVKNLTDEHLLAEHREIKRLPWCLENAIESGSINNIPEKFTLGKGHVLFFLDKQRFIRSRYLDIRMELAKRAFTPQDYIMNWKSVDLKYDNDYTPTSEERNLLIERITERIMNSPKKCFHYYGKAISKEQAVNLLRNENY